MDYALRFFVGGLVVSGFAILGDALRPKSFAGLFGAAPSVAIATLTIAFLKDGSSFVSLESRSMAIGAVALASYAVVVCQLMMRFRLSALLATSWALFVWLAAAFGLKQFLIG